MSPSAGCGHGPREQSQFGAGRAQTHKVPSRTRPADACPPRREITGRGLSAVVLKGPETCRLLRRPTRKGEKTRRARARAATFNRKLKILGHVARMWRGATFTPK